MRKTNTSVIMNLEDVTAKTDGHYVANNIFPLCDLTNLDNEDRITLKFATCEPNGFFLDGNTSFIESNSIDEDICYWSNDTANDDGLFSVNPTITRDFTNIHSSAGVTFIFDENYPLPVTVKLSLDDKSAIFNPTRYSYFVELDNDGYRKMTIEFMEVLPNSRARLKYIVYGVQLLYSQDSDRNLSKAIVMEELDTTSAQIAINTSSITVIDNDERFSIVKPKTYYKYLQKQQRVDIYENIDGEEYQIARHYLKGWETTKGSISKFTCQDILGFMSDTKFPNHIYTNKKAGEIIDEIMADFGWEDYFISPSVYNVLLSGVLENKSHKDALQQVAFAIGCVVDTSRSKTINIYQTSQDNSTIIMKDRIFMSPDYKIVQKELVTEVQVVNHDYVVDGDKYKDNDGKTYSAAITDSGSDYHNIKKVSNATLVTVNNSMEIAKSLLKKYGYRLEHSFKMILKNEKVGDFSAVKQQNGFAPVLFTSMEIDLTGGFLASCKGIGYALQIYDYDRMRNPAELYASSNEIGGEI